MRYKKINFSNAKMRQKSLLNFVVFLIILIFFSFVSSALENEENYGCFPEYSCSEWGECTDGLSTSVCIDKKCGSRDITERKICDAQIGCVPDIKCNEWSQCFYSEKIELLFLEKISFRGYKARTCTDVSHCTDDFVQEVPCQEEYPLEISKKSICGKEYLSATDSLSGREIARIELDSWKEKKLNLEILNSEAIYCPQCYNGIMDENEKGIDCGGECVSCKEKKKTFQDFLPLALWGLSLVFLIFTIFEAVKKLRGKKFKIKKSLYVTAD